MITHYGELIETCIKQIKSGSNLPYAWFDLGKYYLLQGKPENAYPAFINSIKNAGNQTEMGRMIDDLVSQKSKVKSGDDYEASLKLLKLSLAGKFHHVKTFKELTSQNPPRLRTLDRSVLILTGASNKTSNAKMSSYKSLLLSAFRDFFGTIISGGTDQGIGRLAGDIQEAYPKKTYTIGYLPEALPAGILRDSRYSEFRVSPGSEFDIRQPIHYWANILYRWPATDLRMTTHLGKTAIDVSRDGNFYYEEPETPPFLYHISLGY